MSWQPPPDGVLLNGWRVPYVAACRSLDRPDVAAAWKLFDECISAMDILEQETQFLHNLAPDGAWQQYRKELSWHGGLGL